MEEEFEITRCYLCSGPYPTNNGCPACGGSGKTIRCRCGATRPWYKAADFRQTHCVGPDNQHVVVPYG